MSDEKELAPEVEYEVDWPAGSFGRKAVVCGIYFIEQQGFIKIGRAANLTRRLTSHQISTPLPLVVLGHIPLENADEAERHERFLHDRWYDLRHRGEWFRATDALREYIAQKSQPWPPE